MTNYIFLTCLFLIPFSYFINPVSTLSAEGIRNGERADQAYYPYQAAIMAKKNGTNKVNLLCSAVIVHDYFLLGVGHCLIAPDGRLREFYFLVMVGTSYLKIANPVTREVYKIYTYLYDPVAIQNDFAILRLRTSLDLDGNWHLDPVRIPDPLNLIDMRGIVTGYGCNLVNVTVDNNGVQRRSRENVDFYLRSGHVKIIDWSTCGRIFRPINNLGHLCGAMLPNEQGEVTGICLCDAGSPLVINNTLVALASRNNHICDDTSYGSVYTDVSPFKAFIETVLSGHHYPNMRTYKNNIHVPEVQV